MIKSYLPFTSLILLISTTCISKPLQKNLFWNTDFEYQTSNKQPRKWSVEGEGDSYNAYVDKAFAKSGEFSLKREIKNAETYVILSIPGTLIAGQTVNVSAFHKSNKGDTLTTSILLLSPGAGPPTMSKPAPFFSATWNQLSFSNDFSAGYSGENLLIAFMAAGNGTIWTDAIEIKINGKIYGNGEPDFREPTTEEIKILDKNAIDLSHLKSDQNVSNLDPLKGVLGGSKIIALGENSHGSAPIYKMKLNLLQFLVKEMDFTVFALESPAVEADKINEYVLGASVTKEELISNLAYKSWQTEEMLEIVDWIRKYNQNSSNKVYFKGFDMQNSYSAMKRLMEYSSLNDNYLFQFLTPLNNKLNSGIQTTEDWQQIVGYLNNIENHLADPSNKQLTQTLSHYLDIIAQSVQLKNPNGSIRSRDEYMAQNIDWIQEHIGNGKVIISADNDHIRKGRGKTGYYLNENFQSDYYAIGFTFESGTYSAYGPEESYIVHPSYSGTYEYLFKQSNCNRFFIDLSKTGDIPYLNSTAGFRSIGSRPQETTQFFEMNLTKNFDAIIFLRESKHTKYVE